MERNAYLFPRGTGAGVDVASVVALQASPLDQHRKGVLDPSGGIRFVQSLGQVPEVLHRRRQAVRYMTKPSGCGITHGHDHDIAPYLVLVNVPPATAPLAVFAPRAGEVHGQAVVSKKPRAL